MKGDHALARESLNKGMKLDPKNAMYLANRGWSLYKLGLPTDAIRDCDDALECNSKWLLAWEVRGLCKYAGDKPGDGVADLTRAIDLGSVNRQVYESRGDWHCNQKEYVKAVTDLDRAVSLGASGWAVYKNRANSNYMVGSYKEAIDDSTKVIEVKPSRDVQASMFWVRGFSKRERYDRVGYREDVAKSLELDGDYQKYLKAGDVLVKNNSKSTVTIDIDYFVKSSGDKESFTLPREWKLKAGESFYILYEREHIYAQRVQAYVKTPNGKKLYAWDYKSGVTLEVAFGDADLP